ncbi:hypothetical protein WA158_004551 [Blastocystis sp. Blastoise]
MTRFEKFLDSFTQCTVERRLFLFYFLVQFGQAFPWTATTLLLTKELKLSFSQLNDYYAYCYLPWSFKLVFAYISDSYPILNYRRKVYVMIYAVLAGLAMILYGAFGTSYGMVLTCGIIMNTFECATQVLIDALVVERVKKERAELGKGQSLSLVFKSTGTVVATFLAYFLTNEIVKLPYRMFFIIASLAYFLVAALSYQLNDEASEKQAFKDNLVLAGKVIFKGVNNLNISICKPLWPLIVFVLFKYIMPTSSNTMYSYLLRINIQDSQVVILNFATSLTSLVADIIYSQFLTGKPLSVMIICTNVLASICALLELFIVMMGGYNSTGEPESYVYWVSLFIECIVSATSQVCIIPIMIMVSRACPLGLEASVWALFFTFNDLASSLSGKITSWVIELFQITNDNYTNIPQFLITCAVCNLVPLLYIIIIRDYLHLVSLQPDKSAPVREHLSLLDA